MRVYLNKVQPQHNKNGEFLYLRDTCPYGWGTLVKSGAKYMVIEKPEK